MLTICTAVHPFRGKNSAESLMRFIGENRPLDTDMVVGVWELCVYLQEIRELCDRQGFQVYVSEKLHVTYIRNRMAEVAKGEFILFLDDDVMISRDALHFACSAEMMKPRQIVQGKPYVAANPERFSSRIEESLYRARFTSHLQADGGSTYIDPRVLLIPKKVILEVPFNETLLYAGEGKQLYKDLRRHSYRVQYDERLFVVHRHPESIWGLARQKWIHGKGKGQRIILSGRQVSLTKFSAKNFKLSDLILIERSSNSNLLVVIGFLLQVVYVLSAVWYVVRSGRHSKPSS